MNKLFIISFLGVFSLATNAQNIKSVQLKPLGSSTNFSAIAKLGSVLELSFDDLEADNKDYYYKVEHMTHNWEPSNLTSSQYIDGFDQNSIIDVTNSFNTLQPYTHYSVQIPNTNTVITKSGNYLISILNNDYETVFTRRCIFYEDATTVGVAVFRSRNTSNNNSEQTVQFRVSHPSITLNNPNQEIKAVLIQNNDWNTAITNIPPIFIQPNLLIYNHTALTNYPGNNEFLNFDTKYVRSTSLNIAKVVREDLYETYLFTDEPRIHRTYTYFPDINGQFIVNSLDTRNSTIEADYTNVHFSLFTEAPYEDTDIYIYGAFNNFQLNDENKMVFNKATNNYEGEILFKQGFYNYTYATISKQNILDLSSINGSFFETENEYTAIIYYRPIGGFYDRVIGVGNGFFNQNR